MNSNSLTLKTRLFGLFLAALSFAANASSDEFSIRTSKSNSDEFTVRAQPPRQTPAPKPKPVAPVVTSAPVAVATVKPEQVAATPEGTTVITKSFADMGAGREPLRLNTWQAAYMLKLPLSAREVVTGAQLRLEVVNSTALIKSRSELSIRVNGKVLNQHPLDPQNSSNTYTMDIPVSLLKTGYNEVVFGVVQHYTYDCEDPASPELWTEINPIHSSITMSFAGLRPNLDPKLSQLGVAFDRKGWIPRPLSIVSGTEHVSDAQVAAAALVVQGLSLRMGYRPLDIEVYGASTGAAIRPEATRFPGLSSAVVKGRDVLLIGRIGHLSRYVSAELHGLMSSGPFVGVFPAMDGESVILVVTGSTDEDVMKAARAVAEPRFKFSEVSMESINTVDGFEMKPVATPSQKHYFSKFDYRTSGSRGVKVQPIYFEFRAPADYGAKKGDLASMQLHFSYGAGLRKDSSLVVKLNDQFAVSVPLNEETGAEFQKYEIRVPAQFVRPGYNTVTFEPIFIGHKDRCDMLREEGMILTIYEDSTLELPSPTVLPKAPDLARFSAGFWPLQDAMRMYLTSQDTATVSAALSFAGSVAQKNRAPFEVEVKYSPFPTGHMLAIGPYGGMEDFVSKALPLNKYTWTAAGSQIALLQGVEGKRVITALLGNDSTYLKKGVRILDEKGLWKGMSGQAAVIDTSEQTMVTEPAAVTTDFGTVSQISTTVSSWKYMAGTMLALSAVFAFFFVAVLRRMAAKRRKAAAGAKKEE